MSNVLYCPDLQTAARKKEVYLSQCSLTWSALSHQSFYMHTRFTFAYTFVCTINSTLWIFNDGAQRYSSFPSDQSPLCSLFKWWKYFSATHSWYISKSLVTGTQNPRSISLQSYLYLYIYFGTEQIWSELNKPKTYSFPNTFSRMGSSTIPYIPCQMPSQLFRSSNQMKGFGKFNRKCSSHPQIFWQV